MAEAQRFRSVFTPYGKEVAINAYNGGEKVQISFMGIGDGNGEEYTPEFGQEDLKREWVEIPANQVFVDSTNRFWLITEGIIPERIGGNWIREVSIKDAEHRVIAIASIPSTYKPTLEDGSATASVIRMVLAVQDTEVFELSVDTSVVLATRRELLEHTEKTQNVHGSSVVAIPNSIVERDEGGRIAAKRPIEHNHVARLAEIMKLFAAIQKLINGTDNQVRLASGEATPLVNEEGEEYNALSSLASLGIAGDAFDFIYGQFAGKSNLLPFETFITLIENALISRGTLTQPPDWKFIPAVNLRIAEQVNGEEPIIQVEILDENANYTAGEIVFEPSGIWNGTKDYLATFSVIPNAGFFFIHPLPIKINDAAPTSFSGESDGSYTLTKSFPRTMTANPAPDISIDPPAYGTQRPSTATINDSGNYSVAIAWEPPGNTFPEGFSTGTFTLTALAGYRWNTNVVVLNGENYEGELNSAGTILTFVSELESNIFIDPRDGKRYKTVKIGNQTWLAENLNYSGNNNSLGVYYGSGTTPGNAEPFPKAGRLYTFAEATAVGANSIIPPGWHLPSDAEWDTLVNFIGGASGGGTKLKSRNSEQPQSAAWNPNSGNPGDGTDNYGFTGLPGGHRTTDSTFNDVGNYGYWWSSTASDASNAYYRYLYYTNADVGRGATSSARSFSVRCLKD
jgi:uncharacterized protein (TIGR02145 family)